MNYFPNRDGAYRMMPGLAGQPALRGMVPDLGSMRMAAESKQSRAEPRRPLRRPYPSQPTERMTQQTGLPVGGEPRVRILLLHPASPSGICYFGRGTRFPPREQAGARVSEMTTAEMSGCGANGFAAIGPAARRMVCGSALDIENKAWYPAL
jgi:hypothetical protein